MGQKSVNYKKESAAPYKSCYSRQPCDPSQEVAVAVEDLAVVEADPRDAEAVVAKAAGKASSLSCTLNLAMRRSHQRCCRVSIRG